MGSSTFLTSSDLNSIMLSKRANIYYLEYCRVLCNGGRVEFVTDEGKRSLYWNIPIANTTTVLLGNGTSVTQAAMREMSKSGVMVGFCGGGGTPLYSANEKGWWPSWFAPQSEYRPTEYLQHWVSFWFDDSLRLHAAKVFQAMRLERMRQHWGTSRHLRSAGFQIDSDILGLALDESQKQIDNAPDGNHLLIIEAHLTKRLYKMASSAVGYGEFTRGNRGGGADTANRFLDHGNYLAYGLAASATWVLGLPHSLAVLHGKTRRGGLVFDVADLVKDAVILPQAFISAMRGHSEQEFRQACIEALIQSDALDFMIHTLKEVAMTHSQKAKAMAPLHQEPPT